SRGTILTSQAFPGGAQDSRETGLRAGFLFDDDSSPVLRWTASQLDSAGLSRTYARPSYAGAF
ncbi:hypothetical protein, partial [Pseudomonas aeruginosa]|uniref:hypothetical protein n=1 Tax=Pseudomonas aeruginosa TaxID=287 RepID=UPI001C8CC6A6